MATAANNNTHLGRFVDVAEEPRKVLQPIEGYQSLPLVSLEEAVEPIVEFCPDVRRRSYIAKSNCESSKDDLTEDESASIYLYTTEWAPRDQCLYVVLNTVLRAQNRNKLIPPWLLYIKLLLTALFKLPSCVTTIWRGVPLDLRKEYEIGKTYTWWGFSSCTKTVSVLESDLFLGQEGKRTMFSIDCFDGKKVRQHSSIEDEDEIILLPGSQFVVKSHLQPSKKDPDLIIIQLEQVEPPFVLLEPPSKHLVSSTHDSKKKLSVKEDAYDAKQTKMSTAAASSVQPKSSVNKSNASDSTYEPPSTAKKPEKIEIKSKNDQFANSGNSKSDYHIRSSAR